MYIIVPVKRYALSKQRLSERVSPKDRKSISQAMAEWALRELAQVQRVDGILVVTTERDLLPLVRACGYELLIEPSECSDLNSAVSYAMQQLLKRGGSDACVVHADIPLFSADELNKVIEVHARGGERQFTFVADRTASGTNVRLCRPICAVPCLYGVSSAARHASAAVQAGLEVRRIHSRFLSHDLDCFEDIAAILDAGRKVKPACLPPAVTILAEWARDNRQIGRQYERA